MSLWSSVRTFWTKNKKAILLLLAIYVAVLVLITVLASGPQNEPFLYQAY